MNEPDLIRRLADLDLRIDRLDRQHEAAAATLPAAQQVLDAATEEVNDAAEALARLRERERTTAREAEQYVKRGATATRALEQGLGDSEAAQRQIDQCATILDDLETRQLEIMEALEQAEATLQARTAVQAERQAELDQIQAALPNQLAELQSARRALEPPRAHARGELPKDLGLRYDLIRKKKRTAAAPLVEDDSCDACRLRAPMMEASDVRRGLLRTCRGCGRFLIAPE